MLVVLPVTVAAILRAAVNGGTVDQEALARMLSEQSMAFALVSLYVFASAAAGRLKDKEAVSYSLLWGTGALAMLTCLCALAALRQRLGL